MSQFVAAASSPGGPSSPPALPSPSAFAAPATQTPADPARAAHKAARAERKQQRDLKRRLKRDKEARRRSSQPGPVPASASAPQPAEGWAAPSTPPPAPPSSARLHLNDNTEDEAEARPRKKRRSDAEVEELVGAKKAKGKGKGKPKAAEAVASQAAGPITPPDSQAEDDHAQMEVHEQPVSGQAEPLTPGEPSTEEDATVQDFLVPPSTKKANKKKYSRKSPPKPTPDSDSDRDQDDESPTKPAKKSKAEGKEARRKEKKAKKKAKKEREKRRALVEEDEGAEAEAGAEKGEGEPVKASKKDKKKKSKKEKKEKEKKKPRLSGKELNDALVKEGGLVALLSTKWVDGKDLKEYAIEQEGVIRQGMFTARENGRLQSAIKRYAELHALSQPQLETIVLVRRNVERSSLKQKLTPDEKELMDRTKDFWTYVAASVPGRPIKSVYGHLRRLCSPDHCKGVWTTEEDDELRSAVANVGAQWEMVGAQVGRIAGDCKDRWSKVLEPRRKDKLRGAWTDDEEKQLEDLYDQHKTNWTLIAEKLGSRSSIQVKDKWRTLETKIAAGPAKTTIRRTFLKEHKPFLVKAVAAQDVEDNDEIDFSAIDAPELKMFGTASLKSYWSNMVGQANKKGRVNEFRAVLSWLHLFHGCGKYAKGPEVRKDPRKRKYTIRSPAVIEDD